MIKAVLIDVDDTILDFRKSCRIALKKLCKDFAVKYTKRLLENFVKITTSYWKAIERGEITREQLYKNRFNDVFNTAGIVCDGEEFEKAFRKQIYYSAVPIVGARSLLKFLSKRYVVCVASNGPLLQQKTRLSCCKLDKYISKYFVSSELGVDKPSAEFFTKSLESLLNVDKSQVVMIGDSISADVEGSVNFGIKTIFFNFNNLPLPPNLCPDYTVDKLAKIKSILR